MKAALLLLCVTLGVVSCKKKEPEVKEKAETKSVTNKDVSDYGKWYYFSFAKGDFVGEGDVDPEKGDDAAWKKRTDWDIAFHRQNVRTNSGTSGDGKGGVMMLETADFNTVKEVGANNFTVDVDGEEIMKSAKMPPEKVKSSLNKEVDKWYAYNHDTKVWSLTKKNVFIVKTADGKYAKVQFVNCLNDENKSGFISFKYAYQKDGTLLFE